MNINCPIFKGFYGTVYDMDNMLNKDIIIEELTREFTNEEKENEFYIGLLTKYYNDEKVVHIDYANYMANVGHLICEYLNDVLYMIFDDISIKYVCVNSPKYYNYSNDKIEVELKCDEEKLIIDLKGYINKHRESFKAYLRENFTSCDGFISFYSNSIVEWLNKSEYDSVEISSMLEFVLYDYNGKIYDEMMYYVYENINSYDVVMLSKKFIENKVGIINKGEEYIKLLNQRKEYEKLVSMNKALRERLNKSQNEITEILYNEVYSIINK